MRLKRLVEMIQTNNKGAEHWPVLFASFNVDSAGVLHEVEGARQPITSVEVVEQVSSLSKPKGWIPFSGVMRILKALKPGGYPHLWPRRTTASAEPVVLEETTGEVLLITDSEGQPLSLAKLEEELALLMPCRSEFVVDCCETPIVLDGGKTFHIDFPVVGVSRDEINRCYFLIYVFKSIHSNNLSEPPT